MRATSLHRFARSHQRPQAVEVVGERARLQLRALHALPLGARPRSRQHLVDALALDDDRAVGVEHDDVALRIVAPPTSTGSPIVPGTSFSAAATRTSAPRPAGRARAARRRRGRRRRRAAPRRRAPSPGSRAARRRARAAPARASSARAPRPAPPRRSQRAPSGCRPAPQRTVRAGPAAARARGRAGSASTSTTARARGRLVHGRAPQLGELA